MPLEIRNDERGNFDELVASNASIHIEMMSDECVWMSIEAGETTYSLWISSKKNLHVSIEDQTEEPR